ncbi:hypothetical protein [Leuconostoc citreum]|uniref:hypothetical protein n=1 Tax=Leuconostoc citreum TaxID=33964 RepID=UPI0032DF4F0E
MIFDVDKEYSGPDQMISGQAGQGKGYSFEGFRLFWFMIKHPFFLVNPYSVLSELSNREDKKFKRR